MSQIFNIFPTTIYVGEVENHNKFKTEFLKLYDKFDYEENEISSTVSEGQVHPLIHLEPSMDVMFQEIVRHIKQTNRIHRGWQAVHAARCTLPLLGPQEALGMSLGGSLGRPGNMPEAQSCSTSHDVYRPYG